MMRGGSISTTFHFITITHIIIPNTHLQALQDACSIIPPYCIQTPFECHQGPQTAGGAEGGDYGPSVPVGVIALHCVQQTISIMPTCKGGENQQPLKAVFPILPPPSPPFPLSLGEKGSGAKEERKPGGKESKGKRRAERE